jgi:ATP-dependent Clp protease adaptor protein ClpS
MSDTIMKNKTTNKTQLPKMYKVVLLNDHYTTMDFVIQILMGIFNKSYEEAVAVTLAVHKQGKGVAGIYTYDIAQTKVKLVKDLAREHGHPLQLIAEVE